MSFLAFGEFFLREFWWFIIPLILGKIFFDLRRAQQKRKKKQKSKVKDWVVLEVKANREVLQTPKAMEQALSGFHSIKEGRISLEVIGKKKEIHFVIRAPRKYKGLVESQLYAQYPELEIKEVDDYFSFLPSHLPNKNFDLWGTTVTLARESSFPIKTYSYFESPKEDNRVDTLASLIEATSNLRQGELLVLQIIISPPTKEEKKKRKEEAKQVVKIVLGEAEKEPDFMDWLTAFLKNLIVALAVAPVWPGKKEGKTTIALSTSLEGKELAKEVEAKMAQLAFRTTIRVLYIASRDIYNELAIIPLLAYFKQFNTENLNAFQVDEESSTEVKALLFPQRKLKLKKSDFYQAARQREESSSPFILDVEELATIYHPPASKVKGPTLSRVFSRKGEPPPNLPVG